MYIFMISMDTSYRYMLLSTAQDSGYQTLENSNLLFKSNSFFFSKSIRFLQYCQNLNSCFSNQHSNSIYDYGSTIIIWSKSDPTYRSKMWICFNMYVDLSNFYMHTSTKREQWGQSRRVRKGQSQLAQYCRVKVLRDMTPWRHCSYSSGVRARMVHAIDLSMHATVHSIVEYRPIV